jgi:hypothetical protein
MLTRNHGIHALAIGVALLATRTPSQAQAPGPLTNDHPIVIDHLIHLYDGLAGQIATRNAADPEHADSRQQGAMNLFRVSATGYQVLGNVLSTAKARLDAVRSAQSKYVTGLTSNTPPSTSVAARLQDFYQQQLAVFQTVSDDLKKQLSPPDWDNFQAFIAAELVGKIKVGTVTTPKH